MTTGVTQTILAGDPSGRLGNCLQAAVATLLDLPLERVPHFAECPWDWVKEMVDFAREHGHQIVWRTTGDRPSFGLVFGPSVRGTDVTHAVAVVDGQEWDPHPSRAGLTVESTYAGWVPVSVLPEETPGGTP